MQRRHRRGAAVGPGRGAGPGRPARRRRPACSTPPRWSAPGSDLPVLRGDGGLRDPALDELLDSGLLVGDGPGLRFRHELARLAVEQAIPAHRRAGMHARILAALRRHRQRRRRPARLPRRGGRGRAGGAAARDRGRAAGGRLRLAPGGGGAVRAGAAVRRRRAAGRGGRPVRPRWPSTPRCWTGGRTRPTPASRRCALWRELGDRLARGRHHPPAGDGAGQPVPGRRGGRRRRDRGGDPGAARPDGRAGPGVRDAGRAADGRRRQRRGGRARPPGGRAGRAVRRVRRAQRRAQHRGLRAGRDAGGPWVELLLRALDLAVEHGLRPQAGRAYTNLSAGLSDQRRFAEADVYFDGRRRVLRGARPRHVHALPAVLPDHACSSTAASGTRRSRSACGCWRAPRPRRRTGSARTPGSAAPGPAAASRTPGRAWTRRWRARTAPASRSTSCRSG